MGQIDVIMKEMKKYATGLNMEVDLLDIKKVLTIHLEPQKKAELCKSCLGKKQLSEYKGVTVTCADFPGDKSYIIDKGGIVMNDCSRCKGTGEEPIYIPEPQKKAEACPVCKDRNCNIYDKFSKGLNKTEQQQEDKKIELLKYPNIPKTTIEKINEIKINEIITFINK